MGTWRTSARRLLRKSPVAYRVVRRAEAAARAAVHAWREPPVRALPASLDEQAEWQEELYLLDDDPWNFERSPYEQGKYQHTLDVLTADGARYESALEVGCSIGVFTEMLAPHCGELVAVDISATAVERAEARVAGQPHVRVERMVLPNEMPGGTFDLVVCSDVLYYLEGPSLAKTVDAIAGTIRPGGALVVVSWLGTFGPMSGAELHATLRHLLPPSFRLDRSERRDVDGPQGIGYQLDVYRREPSAAADGDGS